MSDSSGICSTRDCCECRGTNATQASGPSGGIFLMIGGGIVQQTATLLSNQMNTRTRAVYTWPFIW